MSEAELEPVPTEPVRTGVPEVDGALESLAELGALGVSEHPAVFEAVHDRLRRALDDHHS